MINSIDSQFAQQSDVRKQLQERLNANRNKCEALTGEEQQRFEKLEGILGALEKNEHVQNRQLKRWLTDDEFEQLEADYSPWRCRNYSACSIGVQRLHDYVGFSA